MFKTRHFNQTCGVEQNQFEGFIYDLDIHWSIYDSCSKSLHLNYEDWSAQIQINSRWIQMKWGKGSWMPQINKINNCFTRLHLNTPQLPTAYYYAKKFDRSDRWNVFDHECISNTGQFSPNRSTWQSEIFWYTFVPPQEQRFTNEYVNQLYTACEKKIHFWNRLAISFQNIHITS